MCCKSFNQFNSRHFLNSYVISNVPKSLKNRHILLVCFIKNNHVKKKLQTFPSHIFIIDVLTKYRKFFNQFNPRHFFKAYAVSDVSIVYKIDIYY